MKYIVVGSGPSGLSLAYTLAKNDFEVVLIEKDNQLGGSWNSQWKDKLYFTENSPRVLIFDTLTQNFLVHAEKTQFKKLKDKSNDFEKYEAKARLNLVNKIYRTFDEDLNKKYNVELNQRTIERVKNSFK